VWLLADTTISSGLTLSQASTFPQGPPPNNSAREEEKGAYAFYRCTSVPCSRRDALGLLSVIFQPQSKACFVGEGLRQKGLGVSREDP
jgi:hypothetical protein